MACSPSSISAAAVFQSSQASENLQPRVDLASGDAPGQGGSFDERFRVTSGHADGQAEPLNVELPVDLRGDGLLWLHFNLADTRARQWIKAAPGICGDPPMTSTQPRPSLSPSPSGIGSGQARSAFHHFGVPADVFIRRIGQDIGSFRQSRRRRKDDPGQGCSGNRGHL